MVLNRFSGGFLVIFPFLMSHAAQVQAPQRTIVNSPSVNRTSTPANSQTPKIVSKSTPAPPSGTKQNVKMSSSPCGDDKENKNYLELSPKNYYDLISRGSATLISLATHLCYQPKMQLKIFTVRSHDAVLTESIYRGTAIVRSAQIIPFPKAKTDKSLLLTKSEIEDYSDRIERRKDQRPEQADGVYLLTIDKGTLELARKHYGVPKNHPMAKEVDRSRIKDMLAIGKLTYDTRNPKFFKHFPLKGAKNLTINDYSKFSRQIMTYKEMTESRLTYDKSLLPKDYDQEIYILSACPGDFVSYNFLTLLRENGYKKLYWFRPGFLALKPDAPDCMTPELLNGVQVIGADELTSLLENKKSYVLDVRGATKKEEFTIRQAVPMEFGEKVNEMGIAEVRGNITTEKLTKKKEGFVGPLDNFPNKGTPIIVFGQNEFDWAGYKAAYVLTQKGYKNVLWYRFGMDDWKSHALVNPIKYPLNKNAKSDDLYL